jgi:hypothetical protein
MSSLIICRFWQNLFRLRHIIENAYKVMRTEKDTETGPPPLLVIIFNLFVLTVSVYWRQVWVSFSFHILGPVRSKNLAPFLKH